VHQDVASLIARMTDLLRVLGQDGDPARYFLGTYLRTTRAVATAIERGLFEDADWVARWDVDFAGLYLDALDAHRGAPARCPAPWHLAFAAKPGLPPEAHVLLGVNAHINFDLPQSLVRMIPREEFAVPARLDLRRRDHQRIDDVLASRVADEDQELELAGGRRDLLDRVLAPANRYASRLFLREARRKVWANAHALHLALLAGPATYAARLAQLEAASAARVRDLLRPGPVLLRLAVRGFGVTLPPPVPPV
jgi:hypothetical protein